MKLFSILLCAFLWLPVKDNKVKLDKKYKVQGTFSGNTSGENSFHLILAKNKEDKTFEVLPYSYEGESLNAIAPVVFDEEVHIVSFHNNDDVLTLITQKKIKRDTFLNIVDVNLSTGEHEVSAPIDAEHFKTVLRTKDQNYLVFAKFNQLIIKEVISAADIKETELLSNLENEDFLKRLSEQGIDALNQEGFTTNGSIKDYRLYKNDDQIIITKDSNKSHKTRVLKINLDEKEEANGAITTYESKDGMEKVKKETSYFLDNKIYQLKVSKKDAVINIFNLDNEKSENINLSSSRMMEVVSNKESLSNFSKQATKSKNQPTITVNPTTSNALKVRLDYVNVNEYSYQNNWWWHHQWMMQNMMWQQQMMQQQMMRNVQNSLPRFGPNPPEVFIPVKASASSNSYVEFAIDPRNQLLDAKDLIPIHKDIDKKKYIDKLEAKTYLKTASTVFTDNAFRYFAYNKNFKSFEVREELLR